jgi:hypothetical protein
MQPRPARPAAADNPLAGAGAKYGAEPGQVLRSSADRNWSDIFAELRFHQEGHLDSFVQQTVEVAVQIRGSGTVNRRGDGQSQKIESRSGAAWLCPLGIPVDFLDLSSGFSETIHLYLGAGLFSSEGLGDGVSASAMANLRYLGGFHDPLVEQIGRVIATELAVETTSGNLLVETLGCSLAARLLQRYLRSDQTARAPQRSGESIAASCRVRYFSAAATCSACCSWPWKIFRPVCSRLFSSPLLAEGISSVSSAPSTAL